MVLSLSWTRHYELKELNQHPTSLSIVCKKFKNNGVKLIDPHLSGYWTRGPSTQKGSLEWKLNFRKLKFIYTENKKFEIHEPLDWYSSNIG